MRTENIRHSRRIPFAALAAAVIMAASAQDLRAQRPAGADTIPVMVHWTGSHAPTGVSGPGGDLFEQAASRFTGSVPRPASGVQLHDLAVVFGDQEYPLRLRVHPQTGNVQVTVALDRPRSCANVYLRRLEKPTLTPNSSVRAALTLGYMIDGRTGENSCDKWPLRAAKARFDRYQNAMARSNHLVIPDAVKDALRATATNASEQKLVERIIVAGEKAEQRRLAISLQNSVLAELKTGNLTAAYESSALLLETSKQPEFASAVATQIDPDILAKQTADLGIRAGVPEEALASPDVDDPQPE